MSGLMDYPNREVLGLGPPWEGSETAAGKTLDDMTKAELLDYAAQHGVDGVDDSMTKADIRAAIDAGAAG